MQNELIEAFDPLEASDTDMAEAALSAKKRMIKNVLDCYVGWYDPFCEMIQNALDAVDKLAGKPGYEPKIQIIINLQENSITVVDNGIGFEKEQFKAFLAPNYSFKDGEKNLRGRKGVGATYLAYAFNYLRVITKNDSFSARFVMKDGKKWAKGNELDNRPQMQQDNMPVGNSFYEEENHGTLMTIKCDSDSFPGDLSWLGVSDAKSWSKVLQVKTALGEITIKSKAKVVVECIDKNGERTQEELLEPTYLMIGNLINKSANIDDILNWRDEQYKKERDINALPNKFKNLDGVYGIWNSDRLIDRIQTLSDDEKQDIKKYNITAMFGYVYSLSIWEAIDKECGMRKGTHVLYGGIQMAVNNMPQGELIQIPLTKNIGRQKQANILLHFENCDVDMGRKGFDKNIVDLAKEISRKLMDGPIKGIKPSLKANTGAAPDIARELLLSAWKKEMEKHEEESPLIIDNPNFFNPVNEVAVLSTPTREQDVIALFNQLLAGGVIRGIKIMSTNERSTYDGLFRVIIRNDELHKYESVKNPLGIVEDVIENVLQDREQIITDPKVLEYKYSLDGLVEDIEDGTKNMNDIDLVVAWEAGEQFKENYALYSRLIDGEEGMRQYHGITHDLYTSDGQHVCFVILLKDLIMKLNNDERFEELQESYEQE